MYWSAPTSTLFGKTNGVAQMQKKSLQLPIIKIPRIIMSYNRFITRCLKSDDKSTRAQRRKSDKLSGIVVFFMLAYATATFCLLSVNILQLRKCYILLEVVAVLFNIHQINQIKYGVKSFVLCYTTIYPFKCSIGYCEDSRSSNRKFKSQFDHCQLVEKCSVNTNCLLLALLTCLYICHENLEKVWSFFSSHVWGLAFLGLSPTVLR